MITAKDIEKLALLARITVTPQEVDTFSHEIESILSYVGQVNKVDVSENISYKGQSNVFRDDKDPHEPGIFTKELIGLSPDNEGDLIKVKKILPSS